MVRDDPEREVEKFRSSPTLRVLSIGPGIFSSRSLKVVVARQREEKKRVEAMKRTKRGLYLDETREEAPSTLPPLFYPADYTLCVCLCVRVYVAASGQLFFRETRRTRESAKETEGRSGGIEASKRQ